MLRNDIYYGLKPLIPKALGMGVRRRVAARTRRRVSDIWPIKESAGRKPKNWVAWPEGKQFALVLTHDVESQVGLDRVRQLAEVEMRLGFRSSFNFIPEGPYQVSKELLEWLVSNGFEVGVHDLHHDGRLYRSRTGFLQKARQINHYMKDWGAVGFRSGFMLHNLNWLHELDIQYDMSTFDTDPFEPQPEGRHTIFPFWVPRPVALSPEKKFGASSQCSTLNGSRDGYVELPYTLPQDSTLFLLLRERSANIWERKLDWIAEHDGMALVNVHPDYIQFDGEPHSARTYSIEHYRTFLEHARRKYESVYWQTLPGKLADFVARLEPRPTFHAAKRICMVTHSYYESDNRVTRYASALAARGDHVDVFALRRSPDLPVKEIIDGVNLFRVQDRFGKTERSKLAYLWPLLRFFGTASRWVTRYHARQRYDLLHIHNVPDFMVFSAWYPKLTGAPVILDIHDIVPEFFASKFKMAPRGVAFAVLGWMERVSAAFATHVIIANHLWLQKYATRTRTTGRCTPFINFVDTTVFTARRSWRPNDKPIILFPGGLQWHQGVDIAIRAFQQVKREIPNAEFHIYGDGSAKESLVALVDELQLNDNVRFFQQKSVREIARIMAEASFGVVPKRADSFGNEAYSTKIMEFMAVGVPVVVSSTKVDRYYFDDSVVRFFASGDSDALARAMIGLLRDPELCKSLIARAYEYAALHCWENRKDEYFSLVDSLCALENVPRLGDNLVPIKDVVVESVG